LAWIQAGVSLHDGAHHFGVSLALFGWRVNQTGVLRQVAALSRFGREWKHGEVPVLQLRPDEVCWTRASRYDSLADMGEDKPGWLREFFIGLAKVPAGFASWLTKALTKDILVMIALLLLSAGGLWAVAESLPEGTTRSLGLLWCLSCITVGLLGGFLFAIPRVPASRRLTDKSNSNDTSSSNDKVSREGSGLGINTNLEEISDWLTKILVGIGLVEAKTLRDYLRSIGHYIGQSLGPNGDVIAVGLVVFSLCIGFLSGFLATRLFISPSLRRADADTEGINEVERVAQEAKDTSEATPELYDVLDAAYATYIEFRDLKKHSSDQGPTTILPRDLADSYLREFNKFYGQPRWLLNRRLHMLMANFYADGDQIPDAMRVITKFIEDKRSAKQVDIHLAAGLYNRACYRAKTALRLQDSTAKENEFTAGLKDLIEDFAICPSDAEQAWRDSDFVEWKKDPRFQAIIPESVKRERL
jgi:hypothetical protein